MSFRLFKRPIFVYMLKKVRYWVRRNIPALRKENMARLLRTRTAFRFKDRQNGRRELLIIVMGYKRPLWPYFFPRLEKFLPDKMDVCIVCPGFTEHKDLEAICEEKNWSILLCYQNKISKAKNVAILNHPKAEMIFKIDEDIMLTEHFFPGMMDLHDKANAEPSFNLGYVAPLLNINGYSYHHLLDKLEARNKYESRFGVAKSACVDLEVWSNGEAAEFMWDLIDPLDENAANLFLGSNTYTICPHRFSIGAVLFSRELWEEMNYFRHGEEGYLGMEEIQLAEHCAAEAKLVVVSDEILIGHFSFGPQYQHMLSKLNQDDAFLRLGSRFSESASARPSLA